MVPTILTKKICQYATFFCCILRAPFKYAFTSGIPDPAALGTHITHKALLINANIKLVHKNVWNITPCDSDRPQLCTLSCMMDARHRVMVPVQYTSDMATNPITRPVMMVSIHRVAVRPL